MTIFFYDKNQLKYFNINSSYHQDIKSKNLGNKRFKLKVQNLRPIQPQTIFFSTITTRLFKFTFSVVNVSKQPQHDNLFYPLLNCSNHACLLRYPQNINFCFHPINNRLHVFFQSLSKIEYHSSYLSLIYLYSSTIVKPSLIGFKNFPFNSTYQSSFRYLINTCIVAPIPIPAIFIHVNSSFIIILV